MGGINGFLTIFITLKCTHTCSHCLYNCSPARSEMISDEYFMEALKIARNNRINTLNFFGGEPLLHPRILDFMQITLDKEHEIMLATNCKPFENPDFYALFLETVMPHKDKITIITSHDSFHRHFFNPIHIIENLTSRGMKVVVQSYSDSRLLVSPQNKNQDFYDKQTSFSCCANKHDTLPGILPDGTWTLCPPSLLSFGSINNVSFSDLYRFKKSLSFNSKEGCTSCLRDFPRYRELFTSHIGKI